MSDARARTPRSGGDEASSSDDDAVLHEDVDLDLETRRRVLELHRALERQSHYDLLGVDPTADAKALKRVYNQLVLTFHPDRYFRKKLGSYKP
ncbi:MAG: J domain-containing protein, partial [Myxococcales bacterium]|nr:J domain-containing protein [Myxococcales bacterium]